MMLADHGAEVVRIDRIGGGMMPALPTDPLARSKRSIAINMRAAEGVRLARALCGGADGLIEGFRPGVMERLGLGPDVLLTDNPKLVYGRMTGWGQSGPYAAAAGHDITYIALSGVLHGCGRKGQKPTAPVNYLGDFGGGGMMLAFGMTAALFAVRGGAPGQVIDCAMTDGSAALAALTFGLKAAGVWRDERGVNLLDSGAPHYDTYETADGKWVALGALEPQFYAEFLARAGIDDPAFAAQNDPDAWDGLKARLEALFRTKSREEWCALLEMTDACFAPVLSLDEAPLHPHNAARGTFIEVAGAIQPAPAPRYAQTPTATPQPAPAFGAHTDEILSGLGLGGAEIARLRADGIVG